MGPRRRRIECEIKRVNAASDSQSNAPPPPLPPLLEAGCAAGLTVTAVDVCALNPLTEDTQLIW
jgi:hypothetical protein